MSDNQQLPPGMKIFGNTISNISGNASGIKIGGPAPHPPEPLPPKRWYERGAGQIIVLVVAGVIIAGVTAYFGWL